jgi:hypothetical protein
MAKSVHASRIGKAVEHLVAASCILASGARLNVSTSLVDDEGVDVVFHQRGGVATIAAQIKSRSTNTAGIAKGAFAAFVRGQTFRPRFDLYLLFVVVDQEAASIGPVWLVPSVAFDENAPMTGRGLRRFNASTRPKASDRWRGYRLDGEDVPAQLANRLLDLLARGSPARDSTPFSRSPIKRPDIGAINEAINELACQSKDRQVSAIDAARRLDQLGLLKDYPPRRGRPLRQLLRAGLIDRAYKLGHRWVIQCVDVKR